MTASVNSTEEPARPPRTGAWSQLPWRHVAWRFVASTVLCVILGVILYVFERMGVLETWERRGFNTLSILLSSLVSLSLGSLLGILGGMLRWPLLARTPASPRDDVTIEYPAMATDWGSEDWFSLPVNELVGANLNRYDVARMNDYAMRGLLLTPISFSETDPSSQQGIEQIQGLTRAVNESHVEYSYPFREFRGNVSSPSDTMFLRSSSTCTRKAVDGSSIYEITLEQDGTLRRTLLGDIDNPPPGTLNIGAILSQIFEENRDETDSEEFTWAAEIDLANMSNSPSTCLTTAFLSDERQLPDQPGQYLAEYMECESCLTGPDPATRPSFYGLSTENSTYVSNILLMLGAFQADSDFFSTTRSTSFRPYITDSGLTTLLTDPGFLEEDGYTHEAIAHLAARLPILAVVGADGELPLMQLSDASSAVTIVNTKLGVKWNRAIGVLGAILGGQLLVSAGVLYWCKHTFVPEYRSQVSTANLLKTVVGSAELSGVEKISELATILGGGGRSLKYKAKRDAKGEWCGAELTWSSK
ncbi:hypothetical protein B0I37DRAFT_397674 [Chaetomium sp. MPI-CAGE-AT-0009]|nr:hypothetical protein B0I37DRAFT_397674 [Chaetomium sp. MPI-CAGE-AT-0009]